MACSAGCGTSCSTNCSTTSSGNCGGCGTSCSTNCSTTASGQSCSGCGTLCSSSCGDSCHSTCTGTCSELCSSTCDTGCTGTCDVICGNSCDDGCSTSCSWNCSTTCSGTCETTCDNTCSGTCTGGCQGCTASCQNDCSGCSGCGGSCSYNCSGDCEGGCYGTCNTTCTADCQNDCNSGCNDSCKDSCNNTCKDTCSGTCVGGCGNSCDNTCNTGCENSCSSNCTSLCSIASTYGETEISILNFDYTGAVQSIVLKPGKYVLECWGAQGSGRTNSEYGGKGGYSVGTLTLTKATTVYIYVGGSGDSVTTANSDGIYPGGFNGGGYRHTYPGGGGASDIRIGTDSLYARVIVAGGGGSCGAYSSNCIGGYGGGTSGSRGGFGCGSYGYGGGQTESAYLTLAAATTQGTTNSVSDCAGGFGFGGFGRFYASGYGGAGGGGWYGGQGVNPDSSVDDDGGGGGGSGYVYTSSTASNYPSGCLLNSSYYLTDAQIIAGNQSFKSPTNTDETGHSGNGYCRITCYISKKNMYCKVNNQIKKVSPIFIKKNDKIYDANAGAIMNFEYTGTPQAISLPRGSYIIECWGAQGGSQEQSYGGAGGYSIGTLTLTQSTDLYIYVGGQPATVTTTGETPGGFNGGGKGCSRTYTYNSYGQGGGGATDVRINKDDLYARIIVAGGGGGSSSANALTTKYGGGLSGGSAISGYEATQTSAGTGGSFGQGGSATTSGTNYNYGSGGGGGGWYGGGACSEYSDSTNYRPYNGGGSGYVYTAETAVNYPAGNYVNSSYYLTNAETIAGNQSFTAPDGSTETGHTGNGFCRITRKSGKIYVKQNNVWIKS